LNHKHALTALILFVMVQSGNTQVCEFMPPSGPPGPLNEATFTLLKSKTPAIEVSEPSTLVLQGQAVGTWQALIILIDFPDYRWDIQTDSNFPNEQMLYTPEHFDNMLFSLGSYKDPQSQSDYTGSMRDFFLENSYGQFDVIGATTVWYTAAHPLAYYANGSSGLNGAYPNNARRLVEEAVDLAAADVDFSGYDNNGDGVVDALFVVHAGPGAEQIYSQNFSAHYAYLWSHKSSIPSKFLDGVSVRGYTLEPQNGTIGVFCHEFGHELGLPDLYDTNSAIASEGIGEWCLMGGGGWCFRAGDELGTSPAHFSAWSKAQLGWLQPTNVSENLIGLEIPPSKKEPVAYRVWRNGEVGAEYFLIENRQLLGFDVGLTRRQKDFGLADPAGLIIYHVDHSGRQGNESRRLIDVEEASPYFDGVDYIEQLDLERVLPTHEFLYNGNRGDNGDLFPGFSLVNTETNDYVGERDRTEFGVATIPSSKDNNGIATGVSISNIRQVGENMLVDIAGISVTSVETDERLPIGFSLSGNYPNPFNPTTTISYSLPAFNGAGARVLLAVYNLKGERVRILVDEAGASGTQKITWDGRDDSGVGVAAGVYVSRLEFQGVSQSRKMILLR
jgi:immune inhibitor A